MTLKKLSSGYFHLSFPGGFAQWPDNREVTRDDVFQPDWNWDRVRQWSARGER